MGDYVIMPNHVHLLVCMIGENRLSEAVGTWKSISARKIGGKSIWMEEYFDHAVRSEGDLKRFVGYIRGNPRFLKDGEFAVGRGSLVRPGPSLVEEG
jgi:REP element-mobilizing transposase RayT